MKSKLQDATPGIMRAVEIRPGKWRAQILFDKCLQITDYGYIGSSENDVSLRVCVFYPNVRHVTDQEFLTELDFIQLFKCRSDDVHYELDPLTEDELALLAAADWAADQSEN